MEMVVLNTSETASDLLDQRSAIYSDKVRIFSGPRALDPSQAVTISSPATYSNARAVSLRGRRRFFGFGLTPPLRNMTGWEPLKTLWLSCLTVRGGVHTESCSATL